MSRRFQWTAPMDDELRRLWRQGVKAKDIGRALGCAEQTVFARAKHLRATRRVSAHRSPDWPAADRRALAQRWNAGESMTGIARALGKTKGAIAGQIHRLRGLGRLDEDARARAVSARRALAPPKRRPGGWRDRPGPAATAQPIAAIPTPPRVAKRWGLTDPRTCQWPEGDPLSEDFHFCAAPAEPGRPYCAGHMARAYRPPTPVERAQTPKGRVPRWMT